MARNQEKAQAMLNRWVTMKKDEGKPDLGRRPFIADECKKLPEAEKWRGDIVKQISRKISEIQNSGMPEHRIRSLNDEINKLIREKGHWERRIRELGGGSYGSGQQPEIAGNAAEVVQGKGYKYFGEARNLPGVRELFRKEAPSKQKRTRMEIFKGIDADYYGYRDDDDGILVDLEKEASAKALEEAVAQWDEEQATKEKEMPTGAAAIAGAFDELEEEDEDPFMASQEKHVAHVPVPSQDQIQQQILQKRKRELLEKYVLNAG